jgi:hypothetical protein
MSAMSPFREDLDVVSSEEGPVSYGYEDVPSAAEASYSPGPGAVALPFATPAEFDEWAQPAWEEIAEAETDHAGRMPWDIATESEEPTLRAATSEEAYGAELESEGLTFYGQEHEFGADSLKELLTKGYWTAAVTLAVINGERDKNKLANMVFWARHPELDGKKIPPGNRKLADEWKAIYKTLVLPPLGPVSPSTVSPTAVPNEQKSVDNLIIDIFNSEQQVLTAWSGALTQFQVVMNAHSDAEGVADFVGAVMKHVGDQVISKIAGKVSSVSYAKRLLDTVTKEYERAREARTSAQLRDFLVSFTVALTNAMNDLGRGFGDYKQMVEAAYERAGADEKKQYQRALADHLNSLDRNWTNVNNVFLLICQEWIRNTMYAIRAGTWTPGTSPEPAWVTISINKDYTVRSVELFCHGGQKIAEQLLKNSSGAGVRSHAWSVPRRLLYFESGSWPTVVRLTADGRWEMGGSLAERDGDVVLAHIRQNGLEATTKVKGG